MCAWSNCVCWFFKFLGLHWCSKVWGVYWAPLTQVGSKLLWVILPDITSVQCHVDVVWTLYSTHTAIVLNTVQTRTTHEPIDNSTSYRQFSVLHLSTHRYGTHSTLCPPFLLIGDFPCDVTRMQKFDYYSLDHTLAGSIRVCKEPAFHK